MTEKLKVIQIIHLALCAGLILVYFVVRDFSTLESLKIPQLDASSMIYLAIPIAAIFLSNFLYKAQLKNVVSKQILEEKIAAYQMASLIRYSVLEGAALLILFLLPDFLILGVLIILIIIFLRPSENQFKKDFE
jgi:hypothetical protein